jgi:transglutaminase-like putative cysteine protease
MRKVKKNNLVYLFFCFYIVQPLCAQEQYSAEKISPLLLLHAEAVVRDEMSSLKIKDIGKATYHYHRVVTILKESGERYNTIYVGYNKALIKFGELHGVLYDAKGEKIRKLAKSEIQDVSASGGSSFFDENRAKIGTLNHTIYPYTVEYEYEITFEGLFFLPSFDVQDHSKLAVEAASFAIIAPNSYRLRYQEKNMPQGSFTRQTNQENTTYVWRLENLMALQAEPYMPSNNFVQPHVVVAPSDFELQKFKGNMETWEGLGKFIGDLNKDRDVLPATLKAKIHELTDKCATPLCKIEQLYSYLQSNTRYVNIALGIGGWQPTSSSQVDETKYGDCKGLSNYMVAMLKEANVPAYYALIYAGEHPPKLDVNFPDNHFNHATVCVPLKNDTIWLECTSQNMACGYLSDFTSARQALLITPDGGKIVHTPSYKQSDNQRSETLEVQLDELGNAIMTLNSRSQGLLYDRIQRLAELPSAEQNKRLLDYIIPLNNVELNKVTYDIQKKRLPSARSHYEFKVKNYASKSGKRLFLKVNVLHNNGSVPDQDDSRLYPVQFSDFAATTTDTVLLHLPQGYAIESLPETSTFNTAFGTYQSSYEKLDGMIRYIRRVKISNAILPKEKYVELVNYCANTARADGAKVVLVKKE